MAVPRPAVRDEPRPLLVGLAALICLVAGGWPALVELNLMPCVPGGCRPNAIALAACLAIVVIGVHLAAVALAVRRGPRVAATASAALASVIVAVLHFTGRL